ARARRPIVTGLHLVGGLPERRVLRRSNAFDAELRHVRRGDAGERNRALHQLRAQTLALLIRLEPQRVIGLDAHLELYAAFEIETELELLFLQPAWRGRVVPRGED